MSRLGMRRERVDLPPLRRRIPPSTAATATVALVAHQTGRIFADDAHVWATVAVVVAVGVVAMLLSGLLWPLRIVAAAGSTLAAAAIGVISVGGELPGDLADVASRGLADLLGSVWPSPTLAAGVGAVAGLAALAAWSAVELVLRRSVPSALLPSLALAGVVALLSAEAGAPPLWWVAVYVVAALVTLLPDRAASRSGVALVHASIMTVIAVLATLLFGSAIADDRFDPRGRVDAPGAPEMGLSPLARLDEWRSRSPATEVFRTSLESARRWRLVGLTRYDGRTWLPADDYRRSSAMVGAADADQPLVPIDVRIGELDAAWLPMVDRTVEASLVGVDDDAVAALRIDGTRSGLLPEIAPGIGTAYQLVVQPLDVQPAALSTVRVAEADDEVLVGDFELSPELLELATTIVAGARTDYERAEALARHLREQYTLDFDSPPGHSVAVIELFLERSQRGRDEQFVAAYGLLAHAVGLPVRIAVGFQSTTITEGTGTVATSDQAIAWPEIDFGDLGWVAFDPVPAQSDAAPPALGDGAVAPIGEEADVPPPTTAAPTASSTPEPVTPDTVAEESRSTVTSTAVGAGVSLAIAAALLLGYVGCVLALKSHRRRRRRRAASTGDRALGAFRSGVDVLVDLGVRAQSSRTDHELVAAGSRAIGETANRLTAAATVATQAVHSPSEPTPEECELAWAAIEDFESATAAGVGRLRYVRSKVSTRSLRRGLPD